jgi:hypothetical protein
MVVVREDESEITGKFRRKAESNVQSPVATKVMPTIREVIARCGDATAATIDVPQPRPPVIKQAVNRLPEPSPCICMGQKYKTRPIKPRNRTRGNKSMEAAFFNRYSVTRKGGKGAGRSAISA